MFDKLSRTLLGDPLERAVKPYRATVEKINALEGYFQALSEAQLRAKTEEFKTRLTQGESLDDLLPEAYAAVREASRRTTGLRHYDVQLIGGIVLHEGKIAEMRTGEGKTLVASLPLYLNALTGRGVHLVTPNDYLSKVGLQLIGPIYHALGLSAAVIQNQAGTNAHSFIYDPSYHSEDERYESLRPITRQEAYSADITYGTNNEFGFDYLRDNMVRDLRRMVQRGHAFAIVDEIDNILIDEARTPLIISGIAEQPSDLYNYFAKVVRILKPSSEASVDAKEPDGDYVYELKNRNVYLTEKGIEKLERQMRRDGKLVGEELYSPEHADMMPYLDNSLRAYVAYERDKEYVVMDGEIIIVDEFTGRLMHGRRFSEGLHQAIEAKEGVTVRRENVTMATITFQNYFRMYDKLAGMTGTAKTEEPEFQKIYNLDVVVIPTHQPIRRNDYEDLIFMSEKGKFKAVVEDIKERHRLGQPVLVGTVAIETSERLSKELTKAGVPHEVLNAKQHFREANIIAQAGRSGAVTIATNMAGRGVDILLGGNPEGLARDILRRRGVEDYTPNSPEWQSALEEAKRLCAADRQKVLELGGLYVLGTERHEARRIDNQLRGRAGRQGDPGESRFYLSLEDDLIRRFGGERVKKFMAFAGMTDDEPIENSMISSSIKQAQVRVEAHNFDIRKRVLEYDDVVNKQREDIYKRRRVILTMSPADLRNALQTMVAEEIDLLCQEYLQGPPDEWQVEELYRQALVFRLPSTITPSTLQGLSAEAIKHELLKGAIHAYDKQMAALNKSGGGEEVATQVEREIYLRAIDELWVRHLTDLSVLREGIGLEGLRGRNPLTEYQIQGFQMYRDLQDEVRHRVTRQLYHVELAQQQAQRVQNIQAVHPTVSQAVATGASGGASAPEPVRASARDQIGRNDPCWCGSGKKYKYCHYRADQEARQTVSPDAVKRSVKKRR